MNVASGENVTPSTLSACLLMLETSLFSQKSHIVRLPSSSVNNTCLPSGENAKASNLFELPTSTSLIFSPVLLHCPRNSSLYPALPPVRIYLPSEEKTAADIRPNSWLKVFISVPEVFHNFPVLSRPTVKIFSPSGEKVTSITRHECPLKVCNFFPLILHNTAVLSLPAVKTNLLSGENLAMRTPDAGVLP